MNRDAIISAAEALLAEGGERAVTIESVAARADVAVQTIYNRVGGRSALLIAVAERALERNREYMDAAYAAPGTPLERLRNAGSRTRGSPPSSRTSSACWSTRRTSRRPWRASRR